MGNTVDIELRVRAEAALAELRKLPGMTEKEARIMVGALGRQWKEAEKQSSKAAAQMARDFDKGLGSIKASAEKLSSMIGGPVGQVADIALDLGEKMTGTAGAIGGAGAAAGGAAVAVLAVGAAMKGLADASVDALKRLEETGDAATLPNEARASVQAYQAATQDLSVAMDRLTVLMGAGITPALSTMTGVVTEAINTFAYLATEAGRAGSSIHALREAAETMVRINLAVSTLLISEAMIALSGSADQAAASLEDVAAAQAVLDEHMSAAESVIEIQERAMLAMTGATDAQIRMSEELGKVDQVTARYIATLDRTIPAEDALARAAENSAEVYKELVIRKREAERAAEAESKAQRKVADTTTAAAESAREAEDQARRLAEAVADLSDQSAALTVNMGTAAMVIDTTGAELPAVTTQWQRASQAVQEFAESANAITQSAGFTASFGALQSLGELQSVLHEQSVAELQDRIDRRREEITEFRDGELERIDALVRSGAISGKEAATRRQEVYAEAQARREAMRQRTADEREAALRSFRAGQALAVSSAIIDAAAAALALIPAFLFLGPLAPVGAATASGLALATQLAVIRQQKPPEFPMGRLPTSSDHTQLAALQPSEAVLTQRGVATLGGPATVQAANDGRGMMGGRMYLQLDRRTLAEVVIETGRTATVDPRRGKIDPWRG